MVNKDKDPAHSFASSPQTAPQLMRLIEVMARLRQRDGGCPWDVEQTHHTLIPCLLEEAYEVVEAIENKDDHHLCEELGDVLLQVIFHAQIAAENGSFDLEKIAQIEADKMIERHPHVFGSREGVHTAEDVIKNWDADKAKKQAQKALNTDQTTLSSPNSQHTAAPSALDGINTAMPALSRAVKLQSRAARVGFDWVNPKDIFAKIREESDELQAELDAPHKNQAAIEEEFGDLFFVMINLARRLNIDPETALRSTNRKFERRFRAVESHFATKNKPLAVTSLEEMEDAWQEVKKNEKC